jgi:membrane protein required for beta-lactamase induction
MAWLVTGLVCVSLAMTVTVTVLSLGASHLSRFYEAAYQERVAHMEADSVENTVALNRLLAAGIALKVERSKDGNAYFLILQGAQKAAQPVNSPEGLAVEVWP